MKNPVITLLTDFGTKDPFVGTMKGVILGLCPRAQLVDLTHEVPPQAVLTASFLLKSAIGYFPRGAVHLAVVDPGVGSRRKTMAFKSQGHYFVGPDNGLVPAALKGWEIDQAVELTEKKYRLPNASPTFHGRDVFAPAAGHLAAGVPLAKLGKKTNNWVWGEIPKPYRTPKGWAGEVLWVDRFGNLITNLEAPHLPKPFLMRLGKTVVLNFITHYSQIKKGAIAALIGSSGQLEISVSGGNASQKLGVKIGVAIQLY